jgi:hypothetical protein
MDKKDAAQPEPAAEVARPEPHSLAQLVDAWFLDHFPGSAVATNTHAWNVVHGAVDDLKRRLLNHPLP